MQVMFNGASLEIDEDSFMQFPTAWMFNLSGEDLKKMILLRWRYTFFLDKAVSEGEEDLTRVFYESQQSLCKLFGISVGSRSTVSKFMARMEELGYIYIEKTMYTYEGGIVKPRHFITVNDPVLLRRYGLTMRGERND